MNFYKCILSLLLLYPGVSVASDFSGLNIFMYMVVLVPTMLILLIIWLINRKTGVTKKYKTIRFYTLIILLSPVPWESSGVVWPSSFILMAGDSGAKATALGFVMFYFLGSIVFSILIRVSDAAEIKKQNENELELIKVEEEKLKSDIEMKVKKQMSQE